MKILSSHENSINHLKECLDANYKRWIYLFYGANEEEGIRSGKTNNFYLDTDPINGPLFSNTGVIPYNILKQQIVQLALNNRKWWISLNTPPEVTMGILAGTQKKLERISPFLDLNRSRDWLWGYDHPDYPLEFNETLAKSKYILKNFKRSR